MTTLEKNIAICQQLCSDFGKKRSELEEKLKVLQDKHDKKEPS